jgi:hypothetical protein
VGFVFPSRSFVTVLSVDGLLGTLKARTGNVPQRLSKAWGAMRHVAPVLLPPKSHGTSSIVPPFQKTQGWGTHFVGCVGEIKELTTRPVIRVKRKVKIPNPLSHRTRKKDGATGGEIGETRNPKLENLSYRPSDHPTVREPFWRVLLW